MQVKRGLPVVQFADLLPQFATLLLGQTAVHHGLNFPLQLLWVDLQEDSFPILFGFPPPFLNLIDE